jgi:hypothetical protein
VGMDPDPNITMGYKKFHTKHEILIREVIQLEKEKKPF